MNVSLSMAPFSLFFTQIQLSLILIISLAAVPTANYICDNLNENKNEINDLNLSVWVRTCCLANSKSRNVRLSHIVVLLFFVKTIVAFIVVGLLSSLYAFIYTTAWRNERTHTMKQNNAGRLYIIDIILTFSFYSSNSYTHNWIYIELEMSKRDTSDGACPNSMWHNNDVCLRSQINKRNKKWLDLTDDFHFTLFDLIGNGLNCDFSPE